MSSNVLDRAQGVQRAGLAVGLPHGWARQVVDEYSLTPVPQAPAWLAGAANVEGRIVPVIDLARWADAPLPPAQEAAPQRQRLLVGGEGRDALALCFEGLPTLLRREPDSPRTAAAAARRTLPTALQPFLEGVALSDGGGRAWPLLDMRAFTAACAQALSQRATP